jgi:HSP20 family protein
MPFFGLANEFDPVRTLLNLQADLDRTLNQPFFGTELGFSGRGVFPPVNVFSDPDGYVVRVEVPGVSPKDLDIETQGRTLTIRGKREAVAPEGASFHRRERGSGEFSRSIHLPAELDPARAEASFHHGLLSVRVPKREEAKPRHITVQTA